jgi:LacI family transcriptional regulator
VGSVLKSRVNRERYEGYQRRLTENGIDIDPSLIYEDNVSFNGGYRIGKKMLAEKCTATAVFAVADIMAIGIMKAFLEEGIKIPERLSIIGFDNIKFGQYMVPGLTTIGQDIMKKGKIAAEMIVKDLKNGVRGNDSITLRPRLVIRESTCKITRKR